MRVGELHGGGAALLDGGLAAAAVRRALEAVGRANGIGDVIRVGREGRRLHTAEDVALLGAQNRGLLEAAGHAEQAEAADVVLVGDHAGAKRLFTRVEAAVLGKAQALIVGRPEHLDFLEVKAAVAANAGAGHHLISMNHDCLEKPENIRDFCWMSWRERERHALKKEILSRKIRTTHAFRKRVDNSARALGIKVADREDHVPVFWWSKASPKKICVRRHVFGDKGTRCVPASDLKNN